jgi:hypothetical protein
MTKTVVLDRYASQACRDFNLKLTKDVIALIVRSIDIMKMEVGTDEAIYITLSVLALAGASTCAGAGGEEGLFVEYAKIAERLIRGRNQE